MGVRLNAIQCGGNKVKKTYQFLLFQNYFSMGLLIPIISLLLINRGASLAQLAIIFGISAFTVFILEVPSGMLADMIGRKLVFMFSGILYLISSITMLFVSGFALLIPAIVFWGAGRAFASGSLDALIIDEYINQNGTDKISKITSRLGILEIAGLSFGAIIGGSLPTLSAGVLPNLGTYNLNLIIHAVLCAVSVLLTILYVKETSSHEKSSNGLKQHALSLFRFIKQDKIVLLLVISQLFSGFFISIIETYWQPVYVNLIQGTNLLWTLGFISFGCFLFAALGNIIYKRMCLSKQINLSSKYTISRLLLFAALIIFSLQNSPIGFGLFFFLLYLTFGGSNIIASTMLNIQIPNKMRSSMLSFASLAFMSGGMLSPVFSSILITKYSAQKLWFIIGIALVAVTFLIGIALHKTYKKSNTHVLNT